MNFSAVIFDLDGTLLNTVEDIAFAMNNVLLKHGFPTHSVAEYHAFVGGGLTNLVYQTIPEQARQPDLVKIYVNDIMAEYAKCIDTQTKPYAGIVKLLDELSAKGIQLAILSNKDHRFMPEVVNTHFARYKFQAVFGARPGIPTKPHPQSALEIAAILGVPVAQIAYVGDTGIDMATATSAGMYPVGVSWGFRTEAELLEHGAHKIIHHPLELLELF